MNIFVPICVWTWLCFSSAGSGKIHTILCNGYLWEESGHIEVRGVKGNFALIYNVLNFWQQECIHMLFVHLLC